MNIICQSLYYQYILDKFHFFKSPKTFRVRITIILCCPCYMPKYVPRLEAIMHIVLFMLYAELCPKVRRHNALLFGSFIMPSNFGTYFGI